ncbi:hypothetical protein HD554DRAFT_1041053 [Boletus coccyginus]|nr:hypothetical protein HD554DRAFT_1041053 [Boletus coccyginus]
MARKVRKTQDPSSDDDAPEVLSHSTSKAEAKRNQRVLHDFEAEENARRKARNREKDQKLKERARVTKGGETGEKLKGVRFMEQTLEGDDEGESGEDGGDDEDDMEARMSRAMRDAAGEVEDGEGDDDDDDDGEFRGFEEGMDLGDDMASGSDSSFVQDEDDEDAGMSLGESDSTDPTASTDDEEMDEDEETVSLQPNIHRPSRKADYLADDLFAAAFASQNSIPPRKKSAEATQQQTVKKRRKKSIAHPKDLVIGGRTIRTLPRPSDPRSQATARSVPSARARRFVNQSLAMKGKKALLRAKKKGWERRPANVGVMKYQGAPHSFARSTR